MKGKGRKKAEGLLKMARARQRSRALDQERIALPVWMASGSEAGFRRMLFVQPLLPGIRYYLDQMREKVGEPSALAIFDLSDPVSKSIKQHYFGVEEDDDLPHKEGHALIYTVAVTLDFFKTYVEWSSQRMAKDATSPAGVSATLPDVKELQDAYCFMVFKDSGQSFRALKASQMPPAQEHEWFHVRNLGETLKHLGISNALYHKMRLAGKAEGPTWVKGNTYLFDFGTVGELQDQIEAYQKWGPDLRATRSAEK
jgi:hypothetical protein